MVVVKKSFYTNLCLLLLLLLLLLLNIIYLFVCLFVCFLVCLFVAGFVFLRVFRFWVDLFHFFSLFGDVGFVFYQEILSSIPKYMYVHTKTHTHIYISI